MLPDKKKTALTNIDYYLFIANIVET